MKTAKIMMLIAAAIIVCSCEKGENWWGKGPKPDYGVFSFNEKETVVEVGKETKSFRLEGRYLKAPDGKNAGKVGFFVEKEKSTAIHDKHFCNDETARFSQAEDNNFYLDVTLFPENITEEVRIVYFVPLTTDNFNDSETWPDRIGETTVVLRPVTDR